MEKDLLSYTLLTIRAMVSEFISEFSHQKQWEKLNEEYKEKHGFYKGPQSLSLQSYIGSDLLIDFIYLARDVENGEPFTNEYWIRSQGTQCCRDENDKYACRAFKDILGKISVTFNGNVFTDIRWVEDEDCLIKNRFVKENVLYFNAF